MMMSNLIFMAAAAALTLPSIADVNPRSSAEPRTAAAVEAVDDAWGAAEQRGDDAFVERLLLPGYRSVSPTGKATDKAAIVAGARGSRSDPAAAAARVAAWKAAHPIRAEVAIYGDTAVLTWVSTLPTTMGRVSSSDIFTYQDGHWRAAFSQHANLG